MALMNDKTMAARLIAACIDDKRVIDHSDNAMVAMVDSLIDITLGALHELAELRGTTVEAILMDLVDD